mgnify:CR=1 FL=1
MLVKSPTIVCPSLMSKFVNELSPPSALEVREILEFSSIVIAPNFSPTTDVAVPVADKIRNPKSIP